MSGSVTLWRFPLDGPEAAALALLTPAERAAHRRIATPRLAAAFAHRRAARRVLLAEATGCHPRDIRIVGEGRPRLAGGGPEFSASHSDGLGILAIAPCAVGADVERYRPLAARLADRLLSPGERLDWAHLPAPGRQAELIRLWCGKEAWLKATGLGLDLGALGLIELPVAPTVGWVPVKLTGRLARAEPWHVCWPAVEPGWGLALAACRPLPVEVRDAAPLLARHGLGLRQPAP